MVLNIVGVDGGGGGCWWWWLLVAGGPGPGCGAMEVIFILSNSVGVN